MAREDRRDTFWFCLEHRRVETFEESDSKDRIGPFDTEAEAAKILSTIAEREKTYDAQDAAWEGED